MADELDDQIREVMKGPVWEAALLRQKREDALRETRSHLEWALSRGATIEDLHMLVDELVVQEVMDS